MRNDYKRGGRVRKGKGMKGMSIKSGDKRPTKAGAGMTAKVVLNIDGKTLGLSCRQL